MNRQQRRNLEREISKNPSMAFDMLERHRQSIIQSCVEGLSASFAIVLRDKFGFGRKRIIKALDAVRDQYDSIQRDFVTLEEIEECLDEELDIRFG